MGRHSVEVLLRIYAKCIDGQDETSKRRIAEALSDGAASPPQSGPETDDHQAHDDEAKQS